MSFSADDAIEIASASSDAENFEKQYPDCVWNVEKMKPRDAEKWLKDHPKAVVAATGKAAPKVLWIVELEELDREKLILIVSPDTKKIIDTRTEKLALAEEEEETESEDTEEAD